jgi:TrmH family RNA methyltransferase
MDFKIKRYKKDFPYSYSIGVYPTIELLLHAHNITVGVVIHPDGKENKGCKKIRNYCNRLGIPFTEQDKPFQRIGARENDYAFGIFRKESPSLVASENHVVLVNPGSTGNLGTIIRTMIGFNFRNLAIIKPGVDIFHPEVVRASMGAIFQLQYQDFSDFSTYKNTFGHKVYSLMTQGNVGLHETTFLSPYCLVFGNESTGLPESFLSEGISVKIPQNDNIDSLNLAVAVGITLYQANIC